MRLFRCSVCVCPRAKAARCICCRSLSRTHDAEATRQKEMREQCCKKCQRADNNSGNTRQAQQQQQHEKFQSQPRQKQPKGIFALVRRETIRHAHTHIQTHSTLTHTYSTHIEHTHTHARIEQASLSEATFTSRCVLAQRASCCCSCCLCFTFSAPRATMILRFHGDFLHPLSSPFSISLLVQLEKLQCCFHCVR